MTPFEIMAQDCDEVILLLNYYLYEAENKPAAATDASANSNEKQYIQVNDRTATGGWW